MDLIHLKDSLIQNATEQLSNVITSLSNAENELASLKNSLDAKIKTRSNADNRIGKICSDLDNLRIKVKEIERFVETKSERYFETENRLSKQASQLLLFYDHILAVDPFFMMALTGSGLAFGSGTLRPETLLRYNGLRFKTYKENGKIFIKLVGANMQGGNSWQYNHYRDSLVNLLGGDNSDFKRRFLNRMINGGGIPLYASRGGAIDSNLQRFERLANINQYVNDYDKNFLVRMGNSSWGTFKGGLKVWDDFSGWKGVTNLSKGGKAFGAFGTVLGVGNNFFETFRDDGNWNFNGVKVKEFAVNTTVDIGTGAAAMATGAAIGSFIAPPIGTVVGLGVGAAVNFSINAKFGDPPKSIVDHTKDLANDVVDSTVNFVQDGIKAAGKTVGNLAKGAGDLVGSIGKGLGKLVW